MPSFENLILFGAAVKEGFMALSLSCACPSCNRVMPLVTKEVITPGLSLNFMMLPMQEILWTQA
jgi:hypothetical protein